MQETLSKKKILKKIREALSVSSEFSYNKTSDIKDIEIFETQDEILEVNFAKRFKDAGGNFIYCMNNKEFGNNLKTVMDKYSLSKLYCIDNKLFSLLKESNIEYISDDKELITSDCSLTCCQHLISESGSIMVVANDKRTRRSFYTSPCHFVFAYTSQIVKTSSEALHNVISGFDQLPSFISFITGPSRTADIEKTLVLGVHGPKELFVFLIDDLK